MVTHSMENILSMQQYYAAPPSGDEGANSPPSRKRRCLAKEQDPMSHRIIEKRRRDRMNNCLADLSRLIPVDYLKKGRGRIEKTEIIEMAIRHMKYLQDSHTDVKPQQQQQRQQQQQQQSTLAQHGMHAEDSVDSVTHTTTSQISASSAAEHYRLGYQECVSETMNFLVEVEGCYARDSLCVQLISHLQQHCDRILGNASASGDASSTATTASTNPFSLGSKANLVSGLAAVNHNNNNSHTQNNNQQNSLSSSFDSSDSCHHQSAQHLQHQPSFASDDSNHSFEAAQQQQQQRQRPTTYKFKNSIKQRFSADQVKSSSSCSSSASPPPSASNSSSGSECKSPQHGSSQGQHQGVPIFALHDNGGYYVPLTLEASLLRPHLSCCQPNQMNGCSVEIGGQEAVLHPVTISVNFSHPSSVGPQSWTPAHSPQHTHTIYEQRQQ